jgi:hypothetical protein
MLEPSRLSSRACSARSPRGSGPPMSAVPIPIGVAFGAETKIRRGDGLALHTHVAERLLS